jgi:hypothetical protein
MRALQSAVVASLVAATTMFSGLAHGAGDAARGNALFHSRYGCVACHGDSSGFPPGLTASDLLDTIASNPPMNRYLSTLGQNATDLADIVAWLDSLRGHQAGLDLDQRGLTGSWYAAATSGQGMELEFFPDLAAPDTALVQGAWFTFDVAPGGGADRQRWYTFTGNAARGATSVPVTIGQNVGGNFDAPPVTTLTVVGSGTLTLSDCNNGSLDYRFADGRAGSVGLTRLTPNVTCVVSGTPPTNADSSLSGNWYDPNTSGQGFVLDVDPVVPIVFLTWFTYAPNGQNGGAAGQRWYTGQGAFTPGSRTITLSLYETTGGVFDQPTPANQRTDPVGTATITFANCGSAQFQFSFTAGSNAGNAGTIALTRIGPVPPGCGG